jgi:hypothetical protein
MDIIQLYQDFGVSYATEGFKYCRPGWVNTECPFCTGNPGPHLGFEISSNHYNCWRCGWHPTIITLSKLINISESETKNILKKYGSLITINTKNSIVKIKPKSLKVPTGIIPLQKNHKQYLESRCFDWQYLEKTFKIKGTGPVSKLNGIDYKHRIFIPFYWNDKLVSFDSRDITGKHISKYMACPKDYEIIEHKHILYGIQSAWKETGIGVEGPTDVWRLGPLSCAISGIKYRNEQVRVIAKTFKRFAVCFDGNETQAKIQANLLVADLKFRGVDAWRVDIDGDPGDMYQLEADYLVKQLIK